MTEDDTVDLRFLDWKEATASSLINRVGHETITEFRIWLTGARNAGQAIDDLGSVALIELLGAELRNLYHRELSAAYPELSEALRYLSFDEALHAVYCATHERH